MKANRITFSKLKLQWDIRKYAAGVILGDEAIGEILSERENDFTGLEALRMLMGKGYDVVVKDDIVSTKKDIPIPDKDLQSSNRYHKYYEDAMTSSKSEVDIFGNVKKWSEREIIEDSMKQLEELGRKLLDEEKYEEMQEAQEIYDKLQKELKKL